MKIPEKIRVHLDNYTLSVLESDLYDFSPREKHEKNLHIGSLMNKVILGFYREAHASSKLRCEDERESFRNKLEDCCDLMKRIWGKAYADTAQNISDLLSAVDERNINILDSAYRTIFVNDKNNIPCIPKTEKNLREERVFVPNKEVINLFRGKDEDFKEEIEDDFEDEKKPYIGKKVAFGDYLSKMMEEYALLPYAVREKICFNEVYDQMNDYIKNKTPFKYKNGNEEIVLLPYRIICSKVVPYSYVLFRRWSVSQTKQDKKDIFAVKRLSGIDLKKMSKDTYYNEYVLSPEEERQINQRLKERDVSFFENSVENIKVKLSPRGIKDYYLRVNLRPKYTEIKDCEDGYKIFSFRCSKSQAEFYFLRFGADAEILEPKDLRKKFKKHYEKAMNMYNK